MTPIAIIDNEVPTAEQLELQILKFGVSLQEGRLASVMISFKEGRRMVEVASDHILYLEADHVYIKVVSTDKVRLVRKPLSEIIEELPSDGFLRVHRSFIVNLKHVEELGASYVKVNGQKIPVGRTFRAQVREVIPM